MTNKIRIIILTLLICPVSLAEGTSTSSQTDINSLLLVGPGVWVTTKPYRGVDPTVYPIPAVIAVAAPFYYNIDTAGCRVFSDSNMTFDFIAKIRTDGFDEEDSEALEGMHNRHMTVDAGGEFTISGNWGKLYTSIVTDTMGQHDGQEFRVTYGKPFEFENSSKITPSVGFAMLSSKLANYYYGVRHGEALPDRPAYEPGVSYKPFVGLDAYGQLDKDWTLFTNITYYRLDSGLRKSPIVNKDYEISILTGVLYKF